MKKIISIFILMLVTACSPAPKVTMGPPGPAGPAGAGLDEAIIQPAPGESRGRDAMISALRAQQGSLPGISIGTDKSGNVSRILIYFDISLAGIPKNATLLDAILVLYPYTSFCSPGRFVGHVYPIEKPWEERACTWLYADGKSAWEKEGGDYIRTLTLAGFWTEGSNATTAPRLEIHLDPTTVQGWFSGLPNYGIMIKLDDEVNTSGILTFCSREFSLNPSKHPFLKIIYKK